MLISEHTLLLSAVHRISPPSCYYRNYASISRRLQQGANDSSVHIYLKDVYSIGQQNHSICNVAYELAVKLNQFHKEDKLSLYRTELKNVAPIQQTDYAQQCYDTQVILVEQTDDVIHFKYFAQNCLSKLVQFMPHRLHTIHQLRTWVGQQQLYINYYKMKVISRLFLVLMYSSIYTQLFINQFCPIFKHRITIYQCFTNFQISYWLNHILTTLQWINIITGLKTILKPM